MSCCRPEGEILTLRAELHYRGEPAECVTALLRCTERPPDGGRRAGKNAAVLRCQTRESSDGTFTEGIFLKGRVGGKKVRIFLDSGSRYNKVNAALLPDAPRETMELPQADISRRLEVQQVPVCRDVETRVGDRTTRLNFVLTDRPDAVLNFDFLRNTIFVLDYDRREIRIKQ